MKTDVSGNAVEQQCKKTNNLIPMADDDISAVVNNLNVEMPAIGIEHTVNAEDPDKLLNLSEVLPDLTDRRTGQIDLIIEVDAQEGDLLEELLGDPSLDLRRFRDNVHDITQNLQVHDRDSRPCHNLPEIHNFPGTYGEDGHLTSFSAYCGGVVKPPTGGFYTL